MSTRNNGGFSITMAFHGSFIAMLIVTVTHYSIGAPLLEVGRRAQDIIVYMPKENVIGPAYGKSVYGGQTIYKAPPPPPMETELIEMSDEIPIQGDEMGRRTMDTHVTNPQSFAPYGQQFYQGDNVHNGPVAYAVMGSGFGRRAQDIIVYRPGKNIMGPAYGESFYGGQLIHNSNPSEGLLHEEGHRRSAGGLVSGRRDQDIIVYRPYTNIIGPPYGHSVYGGQDINKGPDVPEKEKPHVH